MDFFWASFEGIADQVSKINEAVYVTYEKERIFFTHRSNNSTPPYEGAQIVAAWRDGDNPEVLKIESLETAPTGLPHMQIVEKLRAEAEFHAAFPGVLISKPWKRETQVIQPEEKTVWPDGEVVDLSQYRRLSEERQATTGTAVTGTALTA